MQFEFATSARIIFGRGKVSTIEAVVREFGSRPMLVTGATPARVAPEFNAIRFPVHGEPSINAVREGAARAKAARCDVIIGFGGGSAIDAAKGIAALAANEGDLLDYLEVVGRGRPLEVPPLPVIAVPTTAGTGSEVTRNAVLASPEHRVKASLRSPLLIPKVALIDPELTLDLPPALTASTGLDALTQLLEPFVSARANPFTDMFCREGLRRLAVSLRRAFANGRDLEARESMSFASLLGGLALANAGLGVVHGFAAPIGGMFDAPHGAVCAAVLPHGISANVHALAQRAPQHVALARYAEAARILTGDPAAEPAGAVRWISDLCRDLRIPPLSRWGLTETAVPDLVVKAAQASSMKANPIQLTPEELTEIALRSL